MAHWRALIAVPDASDASSGAVGGLVAQLDLAGRGHRGADIRRTLMTMPKHGRDSAGALT
jgi:hypothetical protein